MTKEREGHAFMPMAVLAVALLAVVLTKLDILVGLAGKQPQLELLVIVSFVGAFVMTQMTLAFWCLDFFRDRFAAAGLVLNPEKLTWAYMGSSASMLGFLIALPVTIICAFGPEGVADAWFTFAMGGAFVININWLNRDSSSPFNYMVIRITLVAISMLIAILAMVLR